VGTPAVARRVVALLMLAALVAGCGADTKGDFVARANAICASTVRETRSIAPPSFTHSKAQQLRALAGYLASVLPVVQSEATQLHALRRPTEVAHDRAALARYLSAVARGVASAEAALRASPVTSLAAAYGLRSCGSPGATVA